MFNKHPGGKGDRPILPKDQEQFDNNWDAIFKKKKKEELLEESNQQVIDSFYNQFPEQKK